MIEENGISVVFDNFCLLFIIFLLKPGFADHVLYGLSPFFFDLLGVFSASLLIILIVKLYKFL